jgi:hypothetical protein
MLIFFVPFYSSVFDQFQLSKLFFNRRYNNRIMKRTLQILRNPDEITLLSTKIELLRYVRSPFS